MENTLNGEKCITIKHISVNKKPETNMRKVLDPPFVCNIGLIKPKNRLTLLSL